MIKFIRGDECVYEDDLKIFRRRGTVFDAALVHERLFATVPHKTYLKILERFVDNNLINRISKGVCWIVGQDIRMSSELSQNN